MTKANDHDAQMRDVYAHLYQDRYHFKPNEVRNAEEILLKNLKEFGLDASDLAGKSVMDMGTGRQSVAFNHLGAGKVFHFDISPNPVRALNALAQSDKAFANIQSRQLDMCEPNDLAVPGGLDFCYLVGIMQHLHNPAVACANIINQVNPGGRVYFRNYKSGTLNMLIVECLRRFIPLDAGEDFAAHFRNRFPRFVADQDTTHGDPLARLYVSLYDHLFVPVLNLYDPCAVDAYFASRGFWVPVAQGHRAYDHNADMHLGGIGISLYYQRISQTQRPSMVPFPQPVSQLDHIEYTTPEAKAAVDALRALAQDAKTWNMDKRLDMAIDLYHVVWAHALYTFYNKNGLSPEAGMQAAHSDLEAYTLIRNRIGD